MRVYWKEVKMGQNLVVAENEGQENEGQEEVIGGFRDTKRGIDAYAETTGYDPERSKKGFATIDAAMDFVEFFKPWELHGVEGVTVERETRTQEDPVPVAEPAPSVQPIESVVQGNQPGNKWWEFWRRGS